MCKDIKILPKYSIPYVINHSTREFSFTYLNIIADKSSTFSPKSRGFLYNLTRRKEKGT